MFSTPKLLSSASEAELRRAWQKCAKIAKQAAQNFFYAFLFLPRSNRYGIYALYAFCRAGDDAADDGYDNPSTLIDCLKEKLNLCYQGFYVDDVSLALADTIVRFGLPRQHFDELFLGLETDIRDDLIASYNELELYCYRVAVTIGLLCLFIFECDNAVSRRYAENIGMGMQLTNILRDLREDYGRRRIYLPPDDLEMFGLTRQTLFDEGNSERLRLLVRWEGERARKFFDEADSLYEKGLPSKLKVAGIMAAFYHEILKQLVNAKRIDGRIELTQRQKLSIAYQAISN